MELDHDVHAIADGLAEPGTPIVTFAPGDRVGTKVFLGAAKAADGSLTATRLLVGKDGLTPPI